MANFTSKQRSTAALAAATSANGTTRNGTTISLASVQLASLSVGCVADVTTSSVVGTFTCQVSADNSTWYDVKAVNNAAITNTPAGTGSQVVTRIALSGFGSSLAGWAFFRCNALLSGAATAAADKTTVDYRYVQFTSLGA